MGRLYPAVCGICCDECEHFEADCNGCGESEGSVYWTEFVDVEECPVFACCVHERHLPHCGHCPDLICDKYRRFKDPDMSNEEAEKTLQRQKEELLRRKEHDLE